MRRAVQSGSVNLKDRLTIELHGERAPPQTPLIVRRTRVWPALAVCHSPAPSLPAADGRHGIVRVDRVPLAAKLVDLPCIIESLKTIDKKTFYKTADICQVWAVFLACPSSSFARPALQENPDTLWQPGTWYNVANFCIVISAA